MSTDFWNMLTTGLAGWAVLFPLSQEGGHPPLTALPQHCAYHVRADLQSRILAHAQQIACTQVVPSLFSEGQMGTK